MTEDLSRKRTDVVLSCIIGLEPPVVGYLDSLNGQPFTKADMAALASASGVAPYSMRDLNEPIPPSEMVIPQDFQSYLAGHSRISTSYSNDWPMADGSNRFGEHHPFGMSSNCCPLLHGAAHGEPEYIPLLFDFIGEAAEQHRDAERQNKLHHDETSLYGQPTESMLDLYKRGKEQSGYDDDEEWEAAKTDELTHRFGLLPYLFGLEWNTEEQREAFFDIIGTMASSEKPDSPNARKAMNDIQRKTGITWDRALRSWRDRFTPMKAWWMRPSDQHGPTSSGDNSITSPYVEGEKGHNHHWWEPFQAWGGVGRDSESLYSLLSQSYPKIFDDGWLGRFLTDGVEVEGPHMLSGSHFPATNSNSGYESTLTRPSVNLDFERRQSNWRHVANGHQNHPSNPQEGMMNIPADALQMSKLGRNIASISEMGTPRSGRLRENHPNSQREYHDLHNRHYLNTDEALIGLVGEMASKVGKEHGIEHLVSNGTDINQNTVAAGNRAQLAAAANYRLMRKKGVSPKSIDIPMVSGKGGLTTEAGKFGPVHPTSEAIAPPIFNTGNTDAWSHDMPATLAWRWDRDLDDVSFSVKDEPFTIAQRTPHAGFHSKIDPSFATKQVTNKQREINALSNHPYGYSSLSFDLHKSDDDYEPTGVFESLIEPGHILRDLDDIDGLKGFSGEWVVQKKPKGKHVLVKKSGKSIEPMSLPSKVKKSLKDSITGDMIIDGYVDGDVLTVVDLLVHKDTDMHMEPLSDRVDVLRTLYQSTDNVHFPSPISCVSTDEEGLIKTIANFDRDNLLIRDAHSTFMKGKEVHPKWILYAQDDISKQIPLPPLPELSIRGSDIILEYPSIYQPVVVKTETDAIGMFVSEYEGLPHLVKQAQTQFGIWSPVAALFMKEGAAGGAAGAFTSGDVGGGSKALHSIPSARKRPVKRKSLDKAPEVITEGENDDDDIVSAIMRRARKAITDDDKALTEEDLLSSVDGLRPEHLKRFAGEYGLEQTEDSLWTVNEAIDDDVVETPDEIEKFAFPRMNRASPDGGAWSGMQADITMPTGPTEITDEENTTFGDPRQGEEQTDATELFKPMQIRIQTEDGDAVLEVNENRAIVRFPRKEKGFEENEKDVEPAIRDDDALL